MKLGVAIGYSGAKFSIDTQYIQEIESLGFDSIWTSEAYGSDAVSPAAWILALTSRIKVGTAIMQMPARTPTMAAMTAMTLQALSGGRFELGIGPSGPQVVEGWYGVASEKPVSRTREFIDIVRQIVAREAPLVHDGHHYQIPFHGDGSSGLGKSLKSILHGPHGLKIHTGAITPAGVRMAAEVADGFFPLFMNPERFDLMLGPLEEGFAKAGNGKSLANFDSQPFVPISLGDDLDQCRLPIKQHLALYIGGMGARGQNFYTAYAGRLGYADAAKTVQDLFLDGKQREAVAAIPDALVDDISLIGPRERILDRLEAWKEAASKRHVATLITNDASPEALRLLAEALL